MTYVIYKSKLNVPSERLDKMVRDHSVELAQWTENMRLYEEEKVVPVPPEPQREDFETDEAFTSAYVAHHDAVAHRRQSYPPPAAHPEIDAAVARGTGAVVTFTPDYRVVDDLPPKVEVSELRRLQDAFLAQVASAEGEALGKLVPPGRVRAMEMRASDIGNKDRERVQGISDQLPEMQSRMLLLHNQVLQIGGQITEQRVQLLGTQSQLEALRNWALEMYTQTEALAPQLLDARAQLAQRDKTEPGKEDDDLRGTLEKRVSDLEARVDALNVQDKANDAQLSELITLAQEQEKKLDELVQSSLEPNDKITKLDQSIQEVSKQLSDPATLHALQRPAEDTEFLSKFLSIQQSRERITRQAAQMTSDIEDLTEETAKSWVMGTLE